MLLSRNDRRFDQGAEAMRELIVVALLFSLAACSDTADTFPMNDAAKHLGHLKVSFGRMGVGRGPVTITMADGEVLTGEYRVAFSGSMGMAFSGRNSASAICHRRWASSICCDWPENGDFVSRYEYADGTWQW
jgi:hypothetical protein